jgi:hypothetical protein
MPWPPPGASEALHVARARNFTCAHRADKHIAFPLRKLQ